jgi:hypothetical protein
MDAQSQIFFAGRYCYRKPAVLIGGLVAAVFGGYALRYLLRAVPHTVWSLKAYGAAAFVGGIGGMLAVCGLILLWRWLTGTNLTLEISATGIRYGKTFQSWDKIRWLSGHSDGKCVRLFYQARGRGFAGFDHPLSVDPNPTAEEYDDLMHTLGCALSQKHPDVIFG